ncbi:MAG: hypothetical protein JSS44_13145 [Proteobacteria bacterium]|nr:hypothetical protein [Pseudomonadota bacterium]MBS0464850.1 hypothetical protein [Pseudomonadota bacterium]
MKSMVPFIAVVASLGVAVLGGCSSAPPVDVKVVVRHERIGDGAITMPADFQYLTITVRAHAVRIDNILVNQGRCILDESSTQIGLGRYGLGKPQVPQFPKNLAFGDQLEYSFPAGRVLGGRSCNVIAVEVDTDQGNFTSSFEN